jgi:hypothetical protein
MPQAAAPTTAAAKRRAHSSPAPTIVAGMLKSHGRDASPFNGDGREGAGPHGPGPLGGDVS